MFVLYATSCANNVATKAHRKTLHGGDVIKAIQEMEFDKFVKPLESSLESWKAGQAKKKEESTKRKKAKEEESSKNSKDKDEDTEAKKTKKDQENKENNEAEEEADDEIQEVPTNEDAKQNSSSPSTKEKGD